MDIERYTDVDNEAFRHEWIEHTLRSVGAPGKSMLDVGAGQRPYRPAAEAAGYRYRSHDFAAYDGIGDGSGLQSQSWTTTGHDVVCDILDIPSHEAADTVLCTEVLEHVPDPAASFRHLSELVKPGGHLIVTVPFLSLMHQAPYWFSSGLSPYWFQYWADRCELSVESIAVAGDFIDLMRQESIRLAGGLGRGIARPIAPRGFWRTARRRLSQRGMTDVLESGGYGTFFVGSR